MLHKPVALLTLVSAFTLSGCASHPKLYPNEHWKSVGREVADNDIEACENEADNYMSGNKGKQIAKSAGKGAVVGGAIGGVAGLFGGGLGRGLLTGAAVGTAAGGASAAVSPDQLKHQYVNRCLKDKGYEVLGWD